MQINNADFVMSNTDVNKCPQTNLPEFAFIGRSNVGKSSLINMLTGRKKLAMTSATPGKTLLINHFIINKEWYMVDLPGYGYAQRNKKMVGGISKIINDYLIYRMQMTCLFVLIDIRHEPQAIDVSFINWLGENGIPFAIVFTKADKLSKSSISRTAKAYMEALGEHWEELPPHFITSSLGKTGRDELLDYIEQVISSLEK